MQPSEVEISVCVLLCASCNECDFRRFELHAEMRQRQFSNTCASNEAYDINIMRRESTVCVCLNIRLIYRSQFQWN